MLQTTDKGLYCPAGGFYIDPWQPVERGLVTHAHGDHARPGSRYYLVARRGVPVFRRRLGADARIDSVPYGQSIPINGVKVSFHPAGHILGSAQIRLEHRGEVWVVSGDYKTEPDPTCTPFEPVQCHTFVTECTFGLPVYRWPAQQEVFDQINAWWHANQEVGAASVLFAYALGKAQRVLAGVDASIGPIYTHGAVANLNEAYREAGVGLPDAPHAGAAEPADWSKALIVAPPSAQGTPWLRKFGDVRFAFASGWMAVRGSRRRRAVDRGFVLSDHVDWPSLLNAIKATGAEHILATHGQTGPVVRWLNENGYDAAPLATQYVGESDDAALDEADVEAANA